MVIVLPPAIGRGVIRKIGLECGIDLVLLNYHPSGPFISAVEDQAPVFGFNFSLSGNTAMTLSGLKSNLILARGQSSAFYYPEKTGTCQDRPNAPVIRISIQISPRVFCNLMEQNIENMPPGLRAPAEQGYGSHFDSVDIITSPMRSVLDQIINCPFQGSVRRLFLEGKTMELAALKLEQITAGPRSGVLAMKSDDLDRILEARSILEKNYQNPPNLNELSGKVGMSRTKLLTLFKKSQNTTPAGYVRNLRLEKARQLLLTGEMNVSETAFFVGYSSLSYFAAAFKQYHGILPGRLIPAPSSGPGQNSILPS